MAEPEIAVMLRGGETEGGFVRYAPGDAVRGEVQIVAQNDLNGRHLYVRLQWHTEGRGDRDEGKIAEIDILQGRLSKGIPQVFLFQFRLPQAPWSYAGQYITIVWEIAVVIDVSFMSSRTHSQPFIMAPRRGPLVPPAVSALP